MSDVRTAQTCELADWPAAHLAPPGAITSIRLAGRGDEPLRLPAAQLAFTIGTGRADLRLPRDAAPHVSPIHARLERTPTGMRVVDLGSAHGVYASPMLGRLVGLELRAGGRFWLADVECVALDAELEALRISLAACVGLDDDPRVDRALALVSDGGPLALVGPPGTGAAWLARQIHERSAWRTQAFTDLTDARWTALPTNLRGTVFFDPRAAPFMRSTASLLASPMVRVIVAAATHRQLAPLAEYRRAAVASIDLAPLARRPNEVMRLIDAHWRSLGSLRRVAEYGDAQHFAVAPWPGNLEELHTAAERLLAVLECPSLKAAAHSLGIRRQTLTLYLKRRGLLARRAEDGD